VSRGKGKDNSKAIVRDVEVYLNEANEDNRNIARLLSISQLEEFLGIMKEKFKPSTRRKKLLRIRLAVKFVIRSMDDQLYNKGQRVIDTIEEWVGGLSNDVAVQRREYGVIVREKINNITDPNEFLSDETVPYTNNWVIIIVIFVG